MRSIQCGRIASGAGHHSETRARRSNRFSLDAARESVSFVAVLTGLAITVGVAVAQADPQPVPDPTCVSGLVWRAAYPGDAVCVRPQDRGSYRSGERRCRWPA